MRSLIFHYMDLKKVSLETYLVKCFIFCFVYMWEPHHSI